MAATADTPMRDVMGVSGPGGATVDTTSDPSAGEVRLPARPESAATVRRLTRDLLRDHWLLPRQLTEDAVQLAAELAANAVQHAGAHSFGLLVRRRRGWIRLEIRDPSRALPCLLPPGRELDLNGRGLFLVDALADRWGVDLLPRGKSTWFELRLSGR
ncbi:ATP-binding protein [Streptomyces harbinensis]|uniref:ATP-binding protein n=1 Tax=Streptomyces harbinensis TaxID=1176198 RepID=UPI003F696D71